MQLQEFIEIEYPSIYEEYARLNKPFYYKPDVTYRVITQGNYASNKLVKIKDATYHKDSMCINVYYVNKEDVYAHNDGFGIQLSEISKTLVRDSSCVNYKNYDKHFIPNNKGVIYVTGDNNEEYKINQSYYKRYFSLDIMKKGFKWGKDTYWEYTPNTLRTYTFDSIGRLNHNTNPRKLSSREFRELFFGNPNFKLINKSEQELIDDIVLNNPIYENMFKL